MISDPPVLALGRLVDAILGSANQKVEIVVSFLTRTARVYVGGSLPDFTGNVDATIVPVDKTRKATQWKLDGAADPVAPAATIGNAVAAASVPARTISSVLGALEDYYALTGEGSLVLVSQHDEAVYVTSAFPDEPGENSIIGLLGDPEVVFEQLLEFAVSTPKFIFE